MLPPMRPGLAGEPNNNSPSDHQNTASSRHASRPLLCEKQSPGLMPLRMAIMDSSPCESTTPQLIEHAEAPSVHAARLHPRWGHRRHFITFASSPTLFVAFLFTILAVTPALAVKIPFENCLSDSYRLSKPGNVPLQWDPLYADAVYDTKSNRHNLLVTVWGNVTGSQYNEALPPANDPYWTDETKTNGKIVDIPEPDAKDPKATTLYRKVNVLTYEPWNNRVNFCEDGMLNGTCPLAPTFGVVEIPYGLPSINMSHDFFSSYAFASFSATFFIIHGTSTPANIGCISATITPDLGSLSWTLKFLPLLVLLFAGFAVPFAGIFSPWGTIDIFHWSSNYGRDVDLLRLVTPGFGDCLQYIQWIALTGALTLNYPGFFQPIVSQVGWSSLMFNESFVAKADPWQSVMDGIYVFKPGTRYGLERQGQLIGMAESEDIWPGMMVWLCVMTICAFLVTQAGFAVQWVYRKINKTSEEDLRAKNIPFSIGNVVRIVFNFMLMPIVALSSFQLVVANQSPAYTVALAAVTLLLLIVFASWLLYLIVSTRPKSVLFDDLPTVLRYGPLYNTYSDEVAAFALIPIILNFIRGIAIGAVQPSGIAQVVLLAICEVIQILTLYAFRPFQSSTSMNAYHMLFASLRLVTIMLMVTFAPSLGVTEGPKGWIGYVILLIHACVLIFVFFLGAIQTIIEVVARMLGAGGDDITGLRRGGLSKIFGMRQLSRRTTHRAGPSRASQLSTSAMLSADEGGKGGYVMPSGRVRSGSAASMSGIAAHHRHRSSSALDSMYSTGHRNMDSASSYMPGTPGEASTFSFLASPTAARYGAPGLALEASDPYYRPPRRRRETLGDSSLSDIQPGLLGADGKLATQSGATLGEPAELGADISRGATPANAGLSFPANQPDYSTREVDFYYGVRGPALKSYGPGRKLGTGPADPTGPVATASGWMRGLFGGKSKEKGKGFEVVRSARMPPAMMARNGGFGAETPPEGIPVAMGVIRNGPIDSDDDEPQVRLKPALKHQEGDLLTDEGEPQSDPDDPGSPVIAQLPRGRLAKNGRPESGMSIRSYHSHRSQHSRNSHRSHPSFSGPDDASEFDFEVPQIPRKSSKRSSGLSLVDQAHLPTLSTIETVTHPGEGQASSIGEVDSSQHKSMSLLPRLPFERTGSQRRVSSKSSLEFAEEFTQIDIHGGDRHGERPASFGYVPHHGISRIDPANPEVDLLGSSAELVDEPASKRRT